MGRIGRAHGVRGEVEVEVWTDFPERFRPGAALFIGPPQATDPSPVWVLSSRPHHSRQLLRLRGIDDRSAAATLTGKFLWVPMAEAMPLDEDSYYPHQLIGLWATLVDGTELGQVISILETGATDVLVVRGAQGEVLLPMAASVLETIDLAAGRIIVTPLPGLLD